jgi:uncharacterized membrane protein YgcG
MQFAGLCYNGLCYSLDYTCAKYSANVCPFQSTQEQCLNSKCLGYNKDSKTATIDDCFDPFDPAVGVGGGGGGSGDGSGSGTTPNGSGTDSTGGGSGGSGTATPTITPTTPNGIPCAENVGQCIQFQCLATTGGDGRVVRPSNGVLFGIPPVGVAIVCITIAILIAIIIICCILKHRRAKMLALAATNRQFMTLGEGNNINNNNQNNDPNDQNNEHGDNNDQQPHYIPSPADHGPLLSPGGNHSINHHGGNNQSGSSQNGGQNNRSSSNQRRRLRSNVGSTNRPNQMPLLPEEEMD